MKKYMIPLFLSVLMGVVLPVSLSAKIDWDEWHPQSAQNPNLFYRCGQEPFDETNMMVHYEYENRSNRSVGFDLRIEGQNGMIRYGRYIIRSGRSEQSFQFVPVTWREWRAVISNVKYGSNGTVDPFAE